MEFEQFLLDRYSCRKLSDRPVEPEKIAAIARAGIAAPTACNKQPFKIWILESEPAKEAYRRCSRFDFGARVFFVVGADPSTCWVRSYDGKPFGDVDATIAATQMMLQIHALGLGTTWIASFDAPALKKEFPEMAPYELVAVFPVGYPAEDAVPSANHTTRRAYDEAVKVL